MGRKDAYDRVKWRERVRSWKEVSDLLEKGKMLTIINNIDTVVRVLRCGL